MGQFMNNNTAINSLNTNEWNTIIKPPGGWFDINLKEIWQYRDLIKIFVYRDFVLYYKQTILGPLWWILQPILMTAMFTLVFGNIAKISTDEISPVLFYMSGIILWSYFSGCLLNTSRTFIDNAPIFGKVYFPRLIIPISTIVSGIFKLIIQLLLFIIIYLIFILKGSPINITRLIVIVPFLILQISLLSLGFGIIISSLTTKYRDLNLAISFLVQLWMYATPIVYPLSLIPARWQYLYMINPVTSIIETFRMALLGAGTVNIISIITSILATIIVLFTGIILFSRIEKSFMDIV